jgi:DNA (cytosine-5)-methyltransferase 1
MTQPLVLSLFPGIGLLDMAFEEAGFCVVRGPDLLWGGDVRAFHPPAGKFDGVIGGPPCQRYGGLANFAHRWKHAPEHLIPEYERIVGEARPAWFVMENVANAPVPSVVGYEVIAMLLNNRDLGEVQSRLRRFSFGVPGRRMRLSVDTVAFHNLEFAQTVTSANSGERRTHAKKSSGGAIPRYSVAEARQLQGVPVDFLDDRCPLTEKGKLKVLAQGVPLPMGRAIANAVKRAVYPELAEAAS